MAVAFTAAHRAAERIVVSAFLAVLGALFALLALLAGLALALLHGFGHQPAKSQSGDCADERQ